MNIEVRLNNSITNDPCVLCHRRCEPTGVDPFLAGTGLLVCDSCAQKAGLQQPYLQYLDEAVVGSLSKSTAIELYEKAVADAVWHGHEAVHGDPIPSSRAWLIASTFADKARLTEAEQKSAADKVHARFDNRVNDIKAICGRCNSELDHNLCCQCCVNDRKSAGR